MSKRILSVCFLLGLCGLSGCVYEEVASPAIVPNYNPLNFNDVNASGPKPAQLADLVTMGVPPEWIPPAYRERKWTAIVLHHSATSKGNAAFFNKAHEGRCDDNGNHWKGIGYDFVIGSRRLQDSREERKIMRKIASRAYNLLAKKFLNSEICDHQCGFKAFHRKPLLRILDDVDAVHWFWDTELLVRASQRGFRIKEIPVTWKGLGKTKVNLFTDALSMGFQIFKLWWKLRNQVFTEENP